MTKVTIHLFLFLIIFTFIQCSDNTYKNLSDKAIQVDSLVVKAKNSGVFNSDSLYKVQKELARSLTAKLDPAKVDEKDIAAAAKLYYHAEKSDSAITVLSRIAADSLDQQLGEILFECYWNLNKAQEAEKVYRNVLVDKLQKDKVYYLYYLLHHSRIPPASRIPVSIPDSWS